MAFTRSSYDYKLKMRVPFVDLGIQCNSMRQELSSKFEKILDTAAFVMGKELEKFEEQFADFCGVNYAIGVANGTDALVLALRAVGIRRGDMVITVPNTFIATIEAIVHAGAEPIFVDVDPITYSIDPTGIVHVLENSDGKRLKRIKAIIPVHLYGQPADMDPILKIAKKYNLHVVEDAAQAHGAQYRGQRVGSFGHIGCFSFYPAKNLGAFGDAGAAVTNDDEIATTVRKLRDHGGIKKYQHDLVGYNSRLDSLQAAVLSTKLRYLDEWNERRRKNARIYDELLSEMPHVVTPGVLEKVNHVYHLYVVRLDHSNRDGLRGYLESRGIGSGIHYPKPVHLTKAFRYLGYKEGDFPVAEQYTRKIISLPMYPQLNREQIEYVVQEIKRFFSKQCII